MTRAAGLVFSGGAVILLGACSSGGDRSTAGAATRATAAAVVVIPTGTSTPVPTLTNTPAPTDTPQPTATATVTPAPATATPESTKTPAPTKTATPVPATATPEPDRLTAADRKYASEVVASTRRMLPVMETFERQNTRAERDPRVILTKDWQRETADVLRVLNREHDRFRQVETTPRFAEVHSLYLEALGHYREMTILYAEGLDTLDTDLVEQSAVQADRGTAKLAEAQEMLEEILAEFS